jgi:hypothetical protein
MNATNVSLFACFMSPLVAHAASLDFRVHSFGGGELVLCDAGIRHQDSYRRIRAENESDVITAQLKRWNRETGQWKNESEKQGVNAWNGGALFDENGQRIPRSIASTLSDDHLPHVSAKLQTKIESMNLSFLSSEYGNEFFVDICYHGSALTVWNREWLPMNFNYEVKSWVTATQLASSNGSNENNSYLALAKPKVTASIACDFQGVGAYKDAPVGSHRFQSDLTEMPLEANAPFNQLLFSQESTQAGAHLPNPFAFERYTFTPLWFSHPIMQIWGSANAAGPFTSSGGEWLFPTPQPEKSARYCVFRYTFSETAENASLTNRNRSLQEGNALVEIYLDFKERSWYR